MSTDALRDEHELIQRAIEQSRRTAVAVADTAFVRTMRQTMDDYRDALAAGTTREQGIDGIEDVLRSVLPCKPSKFGPACSACEDTGWREHTCWSEQRCLRPQCATGHPSREHAYVTACECTKGDARAGRTRQTQLDEISAAMKSRKPKPRGFSRMGS